MKKVTKAVFPVAGLGTRFLPATKANPKEMMPVVDKPLIQYAVEEAVAAGITDLIFITGRNKRSISDHFDMAYELENELERNGKKQLLSLVQNIVGSPVIAMLIRAIVLVGLSRPGITPIWMPSDSDSGSASDSERPWRTTSRA